MSITIKPTILALAISGLGAVLSASAQAEECFYESRSGDTGGIECATYHSEISNTRAFLETVVKRGKWSKRSLHPVILDVRSTPEYKAGHPEHSYNVPYPYIYQTCDSKGRTVDGACIKSTSTITQPPEDFVSYVEKLIPNKDTPIYTMCRTGVRSVGAANRLEEAGYTNVRNMWEGFVGVNLKAPFYVYEDHDGDPNTPPQLVYWDHDGNPATANVPKTEDLPVDLNHDGVLNDLDKNGWLYHLGLPVYTRLLPPLIYKPRADTYTLN